MTFLEWLDEATSARSAGGLVTAATAGLALLGMAFFVLIGVALIAATTDGWALLAILPAPSAILWWRYRRAQARPNHEGGRE